MNIGIKLAGDAVKRLERAAKIADQTIMRAIYKAARRVQREAKINVRQKLNTTGQATGALSRSITVTDVPGELAAAVGTSMIYGAIHEFGGTIEPVRSRYLTVPISNAARQHTGSARDFPKPLRVVKTKNGALYLAEFGEDHYMAVHYALRESVTIPERPYLHPALDDNLPWIENDLREVADYIFRPGDVAAPGGGGEAL